MPTILGMIQDFFAWMSGATYEARHRSERLYLNERRQLLRLYRPRFNLGGELVRIGPERLATPLRGFRPFRLELELAGRLVELSHKYLGYCEEENDTLGWERITALCSIDQIRLVDAIAEMRLQGEDPERLLDEYSWRGAYLV